MRSFTARFTLTLAALAAFGCVAQAAARRESVAAPAPPPVVVELFTSQGCKPCLKADALAQDLTEREGVLALTYSVDYWDYLGWRDTFAQPAFTDRQRDYSRRLAMRDVYTPQVVVHGRAETAGVRTDQVESLIEAARRATRHPPDMLFTAGGRRVAVGSGPAPRGGADVWLVRYEPEPQAVEVKRGENRGETVVRHNVVRELTRLGGWRGRPALYRLPDSPTEGLTSVVIVQQPKGGRILAAMAQDPG